MYAAHPLEKEFCICMYVFLCVWKPEWGLLDDVSREHR
jgi:hypothetical protein